jgi:hypothetical protein
MPLASTNLRGIERLKPPAHFVERINQVGGFNRYGEPNFKLAWAQTATRREGGEWELESGEPFVGYRDTYLGDGHPHWMLLQWADAGKSIALPHLRPQSDISFYAENRCGKTGLQILGEYPYHGSYQVALPLVAKWVENGRLNIRAFPLSTEIVEMMIPIIKASMLLSTEVKLRFMQEEKERHEAEYARQIDDAYQDSKLSASARCSSWIEDKVRSIEKHFNAALISRMHRDRVFQRRHAV